jgi:Bifunctional DNA primase/polymerase, N-terminal
VKDRMLWAAAELAAHGCYVFPCESRGKRPVTPNGFHDASRDDERILAWWQGRDRNVGVDLGRSGIAVLDIDSKAGADPREVIAVLGLESYPLVWTGEAPPADAEHPDSLEGVRGAHIWMAATLPTVKDVHPGCELRGGGAYAIAPPSVHESGVPYEWEAGFPRGRSSLAPGLARCARAPDCRRRPAA